MSKGESYIKDVERYFISLAGEGIMLSSADYAIILELRKREVPKEVVLRGISRAFSKLNEDAAEGGGKVRNIKQCLSFIEESIEEFRPLKERKESEQTAKEPSGIVGEAAQKLSGFINDEKNVNVRNYYIKLRSMVLEIEGESEENVLGSILAIESRCLEEFFISLPHGERDLIVSEARDKVKSRGRYMTEKAFSESVISFRNDIVHNRYGVRYLFSYD